MPDQLSRAQVLAYRAATHDLGAAGPGAVVLDTGLQDYPPGRSAGQALSIRRDRAEPPTGLALVHGARGALHLHRAEDLPLLRAALRLETADQWAKQTIGPMGGEFDAAGLELGHALDLVSVAMTGVMVDGVRRTKGELSSAVTALLDETLAPWCPGCAVRHVWDLLFRLATLQAGLTVELDPHTPSQFRYAVGATDRSDAEAGRAELVRRFLKAFGPAKPAHLAAWLGLRPATARAWLDLVASELRPVSVDGVAVRAHVDDLDLLRDPPAAPRARLLPAYDPLLELADREVLLGRPDLRRAVWRTAANPGVLLVGGEIAGTWRLRVAKGTGTITVTPFGELSAGHHDRLDADVDLIRATSGLSTAAWNAETR